MSLLQITLIFFFLVFCLWHCYSHHSLAKQISALQQHKVTPTTNKNIELVGSKESSKAVAMDNSFSVLPSSIKNVKSIGHLRSSSTSRLSELDDSSKLLKSTISGSNFIAMNSRGNGSGGVARLLRTGSEGQEGIQFLGSSSTSSIQDTIVSISCLFISFIYLFSTCFHVIVLVFFHLTLYPLLLLLTSACYGFSYCRPLPVMVFHFSSMTGKTVRRERNQNPTRNSWY